VDELVKPGRADPDAPGEGSERQLFVLADCDHYVATQGCCLVCEFPQALGELACRLEFGRGVLAGAQAV